ncbi:MAG: SPOR domain-containing protein [Rhodospirillales bacterium]|nr:SPOR domain-containing protein [Rhodospirillales bacterium]
MRTPLKLACLTLVTGLLASQLNATVMAPENGSKMAVRTGRPYVSVLPPPSPTVQLGDRDCSTPELEKRGLGCVVPAPSPILAEPRQSLVQETVEAGPQSLAEATDTAFALVRSELIRAVSVNLAAGTAPTGKAGGSYVVLGSFAKRSNAERVAREHRSWSPKIVSVMVSGESRTRVMVGPYPNSKLKSVLRKLDAAGIENPWALAEPLKLAARVSDSR